MKKKEEESGYYYFLGRALSKERKRLGWSQEAAAEKIGINPSDLSRIENGKKPLGENRLFEICRAYGAQVGEVTTSAHDQYQAYLLEREPKQEEPVENFLPTHPATLQLIDSYDAYIESVNEKERVKNEKGRELALALARAIEILKTLP